MKKQIISASLLVTGFLIGATALSAIAGTWTAPGCTPPNCNVDAPVNVGGFTQIKTGLLGLSNLIVKGLMVTTEEGTTTTQTYITPGGIAGKVLTAIDSDGTVGWRSSGGSNITNNFFYTKISTAYSNGITTASCDTNDVVVSGGFIGKAGCTGSQQCAGGTDAPNINTSIPTASMNGWTCGFDANGNISQVHTCYAVCANTN